ncbi:MAG: DUF998 domain-containing protein [Candidatus Heimdallarchaeota archaeon]
MSLDPRRFFSIHTLGLAGVLAPVIGYSGILLSILLNLDWFSLTDNALSDLGHYGNLGLKAFVYNGGLFFSGLMALIFCLTIFYQERAAFAEDTLGKTSFLLGVMVFSISGLALVGISILSEDFGSIHRFVSEVFFVSIPFAMWLFGIAFYRRAELNATGLFALVAGTVAGLAWISYFAFPVFSGVAIPEALSSIAVSLWIVFRGIQYYQS